MRASISPVAALCALLVVRGSGDGSHSSKRGLALIGSTPDSDIRFLTSEDSPLSWYYTWSPHPSDAVASDSVAFLPLLHALEDVEDDDLSSVLDRLPLSSTHLLAFNEPDHNEESGGSDISPEDAAKAYIEYLVPLREGSDSDFRTWNISHPVVTSSGKGLEWLREFNESCYELDPENGCPADFLSVHFYGPFDALRGWLEAFHEFYHPGNDTGPELPIWITEFAIPGEDEETSLSMMEQSTRYLDELDYVEGYAWFGAFRKDSSNSWTGNGVSIFDSDGDLTRLGAEYLGGSENGFEEGMGAAGVSVRPSVMIVCMAILLALGGSAFI